MAERAELEDFQKVQQEHKEQEQELGQEQELEQEQEFNNSFTGAAGTQGEGAGAEVPGGDQDSPYGRIRVLISHFFS